MVQKALLVLSVALGLFLVTPASAGVLTLTFDLYGSAYCAPGCTASPDPLRGRAVVQFDDVLLNSTVFSPDWTHILYGKPTITSSLTVLLPYTGSPITLPLPCNNPQDNSCYTDTNYNPNSGVSQFRIEYGENLYDSGTWWLYAFGLVRDNGWVFPNQYSPFDATEPILQQALLFKTLGTPFAFVESEEGPGSHNFQISGSAFLVDVQETPEPSTFELLANAVVLVLSVRRKPRPK